MGCGAVGQGRCQPLAWTYIVRGSGTLRLRAPKGFDGGRPDGCDPRTGLRVAQVQRSCFQVHVTPSQPGTFRAPHFERVPDEL